MSGSVRLELEVPVANFEFAALGLSRLDTCQPEVPANTLLFGLGGQRLGLSNPGIGAARKADLFADLVSGIVVELG